MSKDFENFHISKALRVRIGDDGHFYGMTTPSSGEFFLAPEILMLLCCIEKKRSSLKKELLYKYLQDYVKETSQNLPNSKETQEIFQDLISAGLIVTKQAENKRELLNDGFGDDWIQWAMISDISRCLSYEKTISKLINSKSIVVDLGAGLGFLTAASLKAGAKKVIAIEETNMAKKIMPFLKKLKLNPSKETLTIFNQNSFDTQLPQNVTHVVSELFGNDPFQEGVIPTLRNLSKQFSKQPVYIPEKVSVYFELIELKDHPLCHRIEAINKVTKNSFIQECLESAKDLFSLKDISFPAALVPSQIERLSVPIKLGEHALNPPPTFENGKKHPLYGKKAIQLKKQGNCVVGCLWFRVTLSERNTLSSLCLEKDASEHWSPILFLLPYGIHKQKEVCVEHKLNDEETRMEIKILSKAC